MKILIRSIFFKVLLARCQMDSDDEVRDRATYYSSILNRNDKSLCNEYIVETSQVFTLHKKLILNINLQIIDDLFNIFSCL